MGLFALFSRTAYPQNYTDTGDETSTWPQEAGNKGHGIPVFNGYGVNPARNNGADLEPIPVTPVRKQNWPEMQVQLRNGWESTNMGKRITYDDYLRLLSKSEPDKTYLIPSGSGNIRTGPAPSNVQSMIQTTSGSQPKSPGGPGFLAGDVSLAGRRYYG